MKKYLISYWKYKNDQWQDFEKEIEAETLDKALLKFRENNPTVDIFCIKRLNN